MGQTILLYVLHLLSETSTYRSLGMLVLAFGLCLPPEVGHQIVVLGPSISAFFGMLFRDRLKIFDAKIAELEAQVASQAPKDE